MKTIYLATPITHEDPYTIDQRYDKAVHYTAALLDQGFYVYCPIVACWPAIKKCTIAKPTWAFWKLWDAKMIQLCDIYAILKLEGWQRSVGIKDERVFAEMLGKEIMEIEP